MRSLSLFSLICAISLLSCKKECNLTGIPNGNRGCGEFMVYDGVPVKGFNNTFVRVDVQRNSMQLTDEFQSFDLVGSPLVSSSIESFNTEYPAYCTDVVIADQVIENTWEAIHGIALVRMIRDRNECDLGYVIEVQLANVVYEDANGDRVVIKDKNFVATVGFTIP